VHECEAAHEHWLFASQRNKSQLTWMIRLVEDQTLQHGQRHARRAASPSQPGRPAQVPTKIELQAL